MGKVVFVDSQSHYTTQAQGNTKMAQGGLPVAGAGAFAAPGMTQSNAQVNFPNDTDSRELSLFFKTPVPGDATPYGRCMYALFDNSTLQVLVDVMPDGSAQCYNGAWIGYGASIFPKRSQLLASTPAGSIRNNIQSHHKFSVKHHLTAGRVRLIIDGITLFDVSAIRTTGLYGFNSVAGFVEAGPGGPFSTNARIMYGNGIYVNSADTAIFSHLQIADTIDQIVGQPRIGALFPDGVGATTNWTLGGTTPAATNWQSVNETTPNDDVNFVASSTVGNIDTYSMQNTAANIGVISSLAVTIRITKEDANSRQVAGVLRIGGVNYVHVTPQGIPGAYAYLQFIWTLSPATGVAFTKAEVDALEAGYKVTS